MEALWRDLRHSLRMLLKKRGFTAAAVLTLALGIGANTAIFSVINAVLLRPLPFSDPDRLVVLWQTDPNSTPSRRPFSFPNFTDVEEQNQSFEEIGAWTSSLDTRVNLTGDPEPEAVQAAMVSESFFRILGVKPREGRTFLPDEDTEGGPRAVVISHGLWQRRFGGDPQLTGKTLMLDGNSYTVIGIMPAGFAFPKFPRAADVWVALSREPDPTQFRKYARGATFLNVIARLKPTIKQEQAQAELDTIAGRLEQAYPHFNAGLGVGLSPLSRQVVGELKNGLLILLGAVAFVLLIACANVANLLLARATARRKEIAIRMALGASRGRIVRQLFTESLLLGLMGGAVGLLLALWGVDLLAAIPYNAPSPVVPYTVSADQIGLDGAVLGFTLGLSLLTAIIFGLIPALQATRTDLNRSLKEGSSRSMGRSRRYDIRGLLVVFEMAGSLVLLIAAGLMIKSFLGLLEVDPGFKPDHVLTAEVTLPRSQYANKQQIVSFYERLLDRVKTLPNVQSVGAVSALPLSGRDSGSDFFIEGQPPLPPDKENNTYYRVISPGYFQAMSIPLLDGRSFTERDREEGGRVAIINESMARRFWPGDNPIGKRLALSLEALTFPAPNRPPVFDIPGAMREIVGVVKDVRHYGLTSAPQPEMFLPYMQQSAREMSLVVRTGGDPSSLSRGLQAEVLAIDPAQPLSQIRTMPQLLEESVAKPRFNLLLLAIFAAVALSLAAVGMYGVISYSVAQRTHEIGLRIALGAEATDVVKMVVGQAMVLNLTGLGLGLFAAFAITRVMSGLLYGVSATDPAIFAEISLLLTGVALAASFIPARRAAGVDPMVALRHE